MSFRYAMSYRTKLTAKDQRKETLAAVEEADCVQDHFTGSFPPGTTTAEKTAYWEKRGSAELILLEQGASALKRRPASPNRGSGSGQNALDKFYGPNLVAGKTPKYKHSHFIESAGPQDQYVLYKDEEASKKRSDKHIRQGLPFFFVRYLKKAQNVCPGVKTPSFYSDLVGRFGLLSKLYKDKFPKTYAQVSKGVMSVVSAMDPSSCHYRGDLIMPYDRNFTDVDKATGFLSMIGTKSKLNVQKYNSRTGAYYYEDEIVRVYDVIYNLSEFGRVFPTHSSRDDARLFLGCSAEDLKSAESMLTLVDFYHLTQHLLMLPQDERQLFSITAFNSGICLGTLQFYGTLKTLRLNSGESYLGDENFVLATKEPHAKRGPTISVEAYKQKQSVTTSRTKDTIKDGKKTRKALAHDAAHTSKAERLIAAAAATPETTESEREKLSMHFNEELEAVILAKIAQNPGFLEAFRAQQQAQVEFQQLMNEVRDAANAPPSMELALRKNAAQRLEEHRARMDTQEDTPAAQREHELRQVMLDMGFEFTRPAADQTWVLLIKNSKNFFGCDVCLGQQSVMKNACPCLRVWMRRRRAARNESNEPVSEAFNGCESCGFSAFRNADFCACMDIAFDALLSKQELSPCRLCGEPQECACPLVMDRDGPVLSLAPRPVEPMVGLSNKANPDFLPTQPDLDTNYQAEIAGLEEILAAEHQPDSWASSGVLPGHLPELHVKYPAGASTPLAPYAEPPSLEEDDPGRNFSDRLTSLFEGPGTRTVLPSDFEERSLREATGEDCTIEDFGHGTRIVDLRDHAKSIAKKETPDPTKSRKVTGYSALPREVIPFDGRSFGVNGAAHPQHFQSFKADGSVQKTCPSYVLYNSPLASNPKLGLTKPAKVTERYLVKNRRGKMFTPKGTLLRILQDTCGVQKLSPHESVKESELTRFTGKEIYDLAKDVQYYDEDERTVKVGNATCLRIISMMQLEPTDIPDLGDRRWLYTLSFSDSHGSSPSEFVLQITGMLSYFSRFWDEFQDSDGQRNFKLKLPGRDHASFALSIGGQRGEERWSMKIAGRLALSLLVGCGRTKTLAEGDADPAISEDGYKAYLAAMSTKKPLVRDYSEGSSSESMMVDPKYIAPTAVGLWRKVKDSKGKSFWYQSTFDGLGYEFAPPKEDVLGHRVLVTLGDQVKVEKFQCLLGVSYFLCSHFEELKARYPSYCTSNGFDRRDKAFKSMRFSQGLLNPQWRKYMELLPRFLGANWAEDIENTLFRQHCDLGDMWRPEGKNGHLARKFLSESDRDGDRNIEETEIIGRVNDLGQFVRMQEEPTLLAEGFAQAGESVLLDHSHTWAVGTRHKRLDGSRKGVSTAEFSGNETF
ncbi:unnamed protein product [Oikopleura dioica]|uniref:EF-hand domain-containing protein n=1 Tax=Oikopleura dioica TaxID=34765 RepID=E4WQA3_OIKDI|nr:unnamed protein product [Oikopleura dioica]